MNLGHLALDTVSPLHRNLRVVNFQRHKHTSGFSQKPEPVLLMSGATGTAACPLSPIAGDPSALPPPTSSLLQSVTPLVCSVCQLLYCTTVLFKVLACKLKNVQFFVFFMYYLFKKYYKPITVWYGLPWGLSCKEPACQYRRLRFDPWVRKIPW